MSTCETAGSADTTSIKEYVSFDHMDLPDELLRGIYGYGFETPSYIQRRGIMPLKEGNDVFAQAQSGTGKTGTFLIGSLARIEPTLKQVQVLVLGPTRELAEQICKVCTALSKYMNNEKGISVHCATGGPPLRDDIRAIEKGCQFLVGTPGRIYDLMSRNILVSTHIKVVVLDEADQMLEDRFKEQIGLILERGFPMTTRIGLFSATMGEDVKEVADKMLKNPVKILIQNKEVPLDGIKQFYVALDTESWKFDTLCDLYGQLTISQALIYVNERKKAEILAEKMTQHGFPLLCIHGEMDDKERKRRMAQFRDGQVRVLISTDMLARGIDVQQVSLVINYELPVEKENYIHRIGRAGRFGRKGTTINLIAPDDVSAKNNIEEHWSITMILLPKDLASI
jgi:translation initiation factor 4A